MEKALLVTIKIKSEKDSWPVEDSAEELEELTQTCGAQILDNLACLCEKPTPNFLIGRGKTEEIAALAQELGADTVIFSHDLSGTQQRNLEDIIVKKTIDRTQLILDIFARHAHSPEANLQVELAQLVYLMPRLIGKGLILSRTGGGIGTSGPGEQRLEVDRRRIRKRIDKLKTDLAKFSSHRATTRKKRQENAVPTVALVGYTNAGKSTLLNTLTQAGQVVSDSLFTTLDTLSKGLVLPGGEHIVISDTVGFLQSLPHHLIEAFKATLEELTQADLLVHVLDAAHPRVREHNQAVWRVLEELGAQNQPMITALNKIDLLESPALVERLKTDFPSAFAISAKFRQGLDVLLAEIQRQFCGRMLSLEVRIPHARMDLVGLFYREGKVREIKYLQEGIEIKLNLPRGLYERLSGDKDIEIIA
jgi:GTP-binding protein HflX